MDIVTDLIVDEKKKMVTLTILTVFCIFLEVFMHFYLGVSIGYTHFFYVLIVLAGIWYPRKAVILALCLAATHTGPGLFLSREILAITGITITENGTPGKGARFEMTVPKGMWRFTANGAPVEGTR